MFFNLCRQFGINIGSTVTNAIVQELSGVHPRLLGLDLTDCSMVTDVGMWALSRHCLHIEKLILQGCDKVYSLSDS